MNLEVTTHRLIFKSNSAHSLLIKGENIIEVSTSVNIYSCRNQDFLVKSILLN